jgi:hypothetical protein
MSGDPIAPPQPNEIDEARSMGLHHLSATGRDPTDSGAYIRVRVPTGPGPDGSVLVYLPNGTGLVVNSNQLRHPARRTRDRRPDDH